MDLNSGQIWSKYDHDFFSNVKYTHFLRPDRSLINETESCKQAEKLVWIWVSIWDLDGKFVYKARLNFAHLYTLKVINLFFLEWHWTKIFYVKCHIWLAKLWKKSFSHWSPAYYLVHCNNSRFFGNRKVQLHSLSPYIEQWILCTRDFRRQMCVTYG